MDNILANAGAPAVQQPTDVQQQPAAPTLGQGEHQAPTPTSGEVPGASGASTGEQQPTVSYEEYQRLREEHERDSQVVNQVRQMVEQQAAADQWNQYKAGVMAEVKSIVGDDPELASQIEASVSARLDAVRDDFNQKFTEYQGTIQNWASEFEWNTTKEQFADQLVQSSGLNPAIKAELLKYPTREAMTQAAQTAKYLTDMYVQQGVSQELAEQEAQRRASGVDQMGMPLGGPTAPQQLAPGNADAPHLRAALKTALGI